MDKILLTAFLTSLAGFITAALSIVKLVNEKESRTTEFRQAWTESARAALAELISKITSQASLLASHNKTIASHLRLSDQMKSNGEAENALLKDFLDFQRQVLKDNMDISKRLTQEMHHAYATVRLHFKPNDPDFQVVEQKFEICRSLLSQLREEQRPEKWEGLAEKVRSTANELTEQSRYILKKEWETIKQGESAYKLTRKWSGRTCIIMFFILLVIGVHAGISSYRSGGDASTRGELPTVQPK